MIIVILSTYISSTHYYPIMKKEKQRESQTKIYFPYLAFLQLSKQIESFSIQKEIAFAPNTEGFLALFSPHVFTRHWLWVTSLVLLAVRRHFDLHKSKLGQQASQKPNSYSSHTMGFPIALFSLNPSYSALLELYSLRST